MPEPNQQNSKATVGVEVPEEWVEIAREVIDRVRGEREPRPSSVRMGLEAVLPHIEQAIRTEEREKVRKKLEALAEDYETRKVCA